MKLGKLALGLGLMTMSLSNVTFAQESDQEKECLRMRFLAGEDLKIENYKGAGSYYLKAEKLCTEFGADNYARLYGSLKNTIATETEDASKKLYIDTLLGVFERAEQKGLLPKEEKLDWGSYIIQSSVPDNKKADALLSEGMKAVGNKIEEAYIVYYYYNLYAITAGESDAKAKEAYKKRMIDDYFVLSKLIGDLKMSTLTQETINTYFNNVAGTCADILPSLKGYMTSLPQEKEMKLAALQNFLKLLEDKGCTDSKEYVMIIDSLIVLDPNSIETKLVKVKLLNAQGKYSDANNVLRDIREITTDPAQKEEIDYNILLNTFRTGSYSSAYKTAMSLGGKYRGEALKIAAQSVAQTANGCGNTTIERKANYIYADELMDRARAAGVSGPSYKNNYPTKQELFDAGMEVGQTITLTCWGVTVTLK